MSNRNSETLLLSVDQWKKLIEHHIPLEGVYCFMLTKLSECGAVSAQDVSEFEKRDGSVAEMNSRGGNRLSNIVNRISGVGGSNEKKVYVGSGAAPTIRVWSISDENKTNLKKAFEQIAPL